ncbi:LytTR family transcriptional regulator [Runella rosea]|uniref:LytTR family transcriptional regulator n=1 Tax=Runella rosea TaxID=2259595 RepID=A0A344TPK1_9BACT|nr:LytTR family DNA-binding domain-containing protein [Runella rosea]AXE20572.1 LytTR family transcriptional regulator [Runella rosea]
MSVQSFIPTIDSAVYLPRFQTKEGERAIDPRRIVYLSAQLNYTLFYLDDGEQVLTSLSLSSYALLLEDYGFIRVHKSHLINGYHLSKCRLNLNRELRLPNGKVIEVARRRHVGLKKRISSQVGSCAQKSFTATI